jgi:hypothetical protein
MTKELIEKMAAVTFPYLDINEAENEFEANYVLTFNDSQKLLRQGFVTGYALCLENNKFLNETRPLPDGILAQLKNVIP